MKCKIDARGLACPQPVVLAKNRMKECNLIEITVDNETAKENLNRLASSSGWLFEVTPSGHDFKILLKSTNAVQPDISNSTTVPDQESGRVVVFSSDRMGSGDDDLGALLIKAFIHTLAENEKVPSKLLFYNTGVKLTSDNSGVTDDLLSLQDKGAELLICGTCVNYFNLKEKIHVGTISNMSEILDTMNGASRIINP